MITACSSRLCQMQGESRFSHCRTCSKDIQLSPLPSRSQFVQIGETGRDTCNTIPAILNTGFHLRQGIFHQLPHSAKMVGSPHISFKAVQQIVHAHQYIRDVYRLIGSGSQLLIRTENHLTTDKQFPKYARMIFQMGTRCDARSKPHQIIRPAHLLQVAA